MVGTFGRADGTNDDWARQVLEQAIAHDIRYFAYVPDAGNARFIMLAQTEPGCRTVLLTTEEEGVAFCAGIDLVGKRGMLVLQSSVIGNCGNFLSLVRGARFPLLMLVTMRGEYGEQNPWQYASGQAARPLLDAMGIISFRVETRSDLAPATDAAICAAFLSGHGAALILSQRFLGAKVL
jgi:sulfopyruvate decarboxylase TPP-binding subunit